jgi:hypothetical protein
MSSFPPQAPVPLAPAWREIGRPSPEEAPVWTTWVAPLGEAGDTLYRTLGSSLFQVGRLSSSLPAIR